MNDPFTILPANLGGLARITADASTRYSLTGVFVTLKEGKYEAAATDGKKLAVVSGTSEADPWEIPSISEFDNLPPSASQAVIPTKVWKEAFASAPKRKGVPGAGQVAVHLGAQSSLLATTNGGEANVLSTENVEGRFPDYKAVLHVGTRQPAVTIRLDPALLLDLVKLAQDFNKDCITLEVHGSHEPIVMRSENETQQFVALLMPRTA